MQYQCHVFLIELGPLDCSFEFLLVACIRSVCGGLVVCVSLVKSDIHTVGSFIWHDIVFHGCFTSDRLGV